MDILEKIDEKLINLKERVKFHGGGSTEQDSELVQVAKKMKKSRKPQSFRYKEKPWSRADSEKRSWEK